MTDIWTEWNALRHELSEGNAKQEAIINKMERVVEGASAKIAALTAQHVADAEVAREYVTHFDNFVGGQLSRVRSLILDANEVLATKENPTIRGYLEKDTADKDAIVALLQLAARAGSVSHA